MDKTLSARDSRIDTPDVRLRVFISSTLEELAAERMAAKKAITNLHLTPVMFELGARPYAPRDVYSAYLAQSQIFIGIYGEKYGWIIPEMDISGLEDEFHLSEHHPRLIYIKRPAPNRADRLKNMIDVILNSGISCKFFSDIDDLTSIIENDLALLLTERFQQSSHIEQIIGEHSIIPIPATPIIWRDAEIKEIKDYLLQKEIRLVTLTGTGGIGKTRIALEVAHQLHHVYKDGVFFVPLASITDASLVPSTIVQAIFPGELAGQPPLQLLIKLFADKQVLLVLDNFEQVIDAAAFVSELMNESEGLDILVTSRESLRISGEQVFPVPMLSLPDTSDDVQDTEIFKQKIKESPSVQLFMQRVKALNPSFELTRENASAIAQICIQLDGLPLAIELAAARIRVLTPQEMLPHLEKGLALLSTGKRDMPERHRMLSATINWSYRMLPKAEQQFLCALSIFSGGCTLASAAAVSSNNDIQIGPFPRLAMYLNNPSVRFHSFPDVSLTFLEGMESLIAKNLIYTREDEGEKRFMIYNTIREFAFEQLQENGTLEGISNNHFTYYLHLAESTWGTLFGKDASAGYELLDKEIDNLRVALEWGLKHDPISGLRLSLALGEYWDTRGMPDEQIKWTSALANASESEKNADAHVLHALAKIEMGRAAFRENDHAYSTLLAEEVTKLATETNNKYLFVDSVMVRSMVSAYTGELSKIKSSMEEALQASRDLNYKMGTVNLLQNLAAAANMEGRSEEVMSFSHESLGIASELGATRWECISYIMQGLTQMSTGAMEASVENFSRSLACCRRFMDSVLVVYPLIGMGQVALMQGNTEKAILLLGSAEKLCERKGTAIVPMVRHIVGMIQQAAKSMVGPEDYKRLLDKGGKLQLTEAMDIAERT